MLAAIQADYQTRLTDNGWLPVPTENRGSGGAVLCDIPKSMNSLWYHYTRQKHGWMLTDIGWTAVPTENSGSEGSRFVWHITYKFYIIALQEAGSGLNQWALYHYITSLGDGTADADGWLKMTVQWWWFQTHCSGIRAHLKRVSPCTFLWWLVAQTAVSVWFMQQPWFLVSRTYVANALYNHLPHQVKRERHYKLYTRTSA